MRAEEPYARKLRDANYLFRKIYGFVKVCVLDICIKKCVSCNLARLKSKHVSETTVGDRGERPAADGFRMGAK